MDDRADFPKLGERLLDRRGEIWHAVLARVRQVAVLPADVAGGYEEGVRGAALAAVDYGRRVLDGRGEDLPEVPPQLLAQARLAAASGVGVDSVVRRYFGGYSAFSAAIIQEAHKSSLSPQSVQQLMDRQAEAFDRLISAVTKEYADEVGLRAASKQVRQMERISKLLAGAPVDSRDLGYELEQCHLGLVTSASQPKPLLREIARHLDRQVLVAERTEHETWAWFGGRDELGREDLERVLARVWPKAFPLALGEDCTGRTGWCLTHRQALRSWPSATRSPGEIVRYRHVALSSAIVRDEDLVSFLQQSYLVPLLGETGSKESSLCTTLRAYFRAGENVSSTAAALAVSRQTVTNRIRQVEVRLGEQIANCRVELECALRLERQGAGLGAVQIT